MCLDESITSVDRAEDMIALRRGRIINIKPGRVGGFSSVEGHSRRLRRQNGIPVWCGGMLESGIGRAYNVALASLPNFSLPGDLSPSARYWERDVVTPEWTMDAEGMVHVPLDSPASASPSTWTASRHSRCAAKSCVRPRDGWSCREPCAPDAARSFPTRCASGSSLCAGTFTRIPSCRSRKQRTADELSASLRLRSPSAVDARGGHRRRRARSPGAIRSAPVVAIRGDIDALPIQEATGLAVRVDVTPA